MKYPKILAEISSNQWAITPEALNGILSALNGELSAEDYRLFHAVSQEQKEAFASEAGSRPEGTRFTRIDGKNGFLFIDGPIIPRSSGISDISGLTSISQLTKEWIALESNESIETIVGVFDTPGGAVAGVSDFAKLVQASEKNTIAFVFGNAASAGYWIASAFKTIVSSDTGLVGSIGVVMTVVVTDNDRIVEIVSSQSPFKRDNVKTKAGRERAKTIVDDLADVFIGSVAEFRGVKPAKILNSYGKGAMVVAARAKKAGMIDAISTLRDLIESINSAEAGAESEAPEAKDENIKNPINKPAGAGETTTEEKMNLQEAINDSPTIAGEVDEMKKAAFAEGAKSADAKIKAAIPYLSGSDYPESIKTIACSVLSGDEDPAALRGAVIAFDALKEDKNAKAASDEQPEETPAQLETETISEDGTVSNEAEVQAAIESLKGVK